MARRERSVGELELEVLKVIWERQPCTVVEVAEIIGRHRGNAPTTVLTVMQRLHAKGLLKRRKRRGIYHYSTTQDRGKVVGGLIDNFVHKVLDGSPLPFVAHLAEAGSLTEEQAETLRKIMRSLEKKSGEGRR
jgi:predicted transcriptional regulator